jgi:hypothetical protein
VTNILKCLKVWISLRVSEVGIFEKDGSPLLETIANNPFFYQGDGRGH